VVTAHNASDRVRHEATETLRLPQWRRRQHVERGRPEMRNRSACAGRWMVSELATVRSCIVERQSDGSSIVAQRFGDVGKDVPVTAQRPRESLATHRRLPDSHVPVCTASARRAGMGPDGGSAARDSSSNGKRVSDWKTPGVASRRYGRGAAQRARYPMSAAASTVLRAAAHARTDSAAARSTVVAAAVACSAGFAAIHA